MAAVYSHSQRQRSQDPFIDPQQPRRRRPPPPPPKSAQNTARMPSAATKSASAPSHDVREAVRDTVAYRSSAETPRNRPSRSNTASSPTAQPNAPKPTGRRSQSEDSAHVVEKSRSSGKTKSKKGSQHADVIDRMDFTGVGPMFHHDGPFDACAPSRNKHKTKAPMYAWSASPQGGDGAYPSSAHAYQAFTNDYPEPPKKKVDAIAEAWGIHEPEPFEEFFAGGGTGKPEGDTPASSIYNGRDSNRAQRRPKDDSREGRSRVTTTRRTGVPPPQPIFVPEATEVAEQGAAGSPPAGSPGFPKRSKSLMQRFRKMRDAPNVPVSADYDAPPVSPSSPTYASAIEGNTSRPTHRTQNSFLGRFGVRSNQSAHVAPQDEKPEPYVFIDNQSSNRQDKALPATPQARIDGSSRENTRPSFGHHDGQAQAQQGGPHLGRKTSLIKKVGRVVRGK